MKTRQKFHHQDKVLMKNIGFPKKHTKIVSFDPNLNFDERTKIDSKKLNPKLHLHTHLSNIV